MAFLRSMRTTFDSGPAHQSPRCMKQLRMSEDFANIFIMQRCLDHIRFFCLRAPALKFPSDAILRSINDFSWVSISIQLFTAFQGKKHPIHAVLYEGGNVRKSFKGGEEFAKLLLMFNI